MDSQRSCLTKSEIKTYLDKSVSEQERFEIENHLLDCNLCQDAIDGYIQHSQELNQAQRIQIPTPYRKWLVIAASFLFLLICSIAIYKYQFANRGNSVFAQFYQKPSWDNQTRGNESPNDYSNAIQSYNQGLYQSALPSFDSILANDDEDNQMRLYKGIAHLEMAQYQEAEVELNTVRINSDRYFLDATWYIALINIKLGKTQEANAFLDEIIEVQNSPFHNQALEMKNKLQK